MSALEFRLPEELGEIAEMAADYLGGRAADDTAGAELGWYGVGIPEEAGGSGGTREVVAVLAEAAGAAHAAAPIGLTAGVVGQLLLDSPSGPAAAILSELSDGVFRPLVPAIDPRAAAGGVTPDGSGRITTSISAYGARSATHLVLPVGGDSGGVAIIDLGTPGVEVAEAAAMDVSRPLFTVRVTDVELGAARLLLPSAAIDRMTALSALMTALDSAGAAKQALAATLEFARVRHQFGRPIASFQAYKHRCADAYVLLRLCQSAAFRAARAGGLASAYDAAMDATRSATFICGEAVQLHGAMGFSWESGIHVLLKRARANELFWRPTITTLNAPKVED